MRQNFTRELSADGKTWTAVFLPHLRHNGMHYEVNVRGLPRFMMKMSELGRFDITQLNDKVPYAVILAASDAIEAYEKRI